MSKRLVIVESPAKARTIAGYLGPTSGVPVGHIRDLPDSAAEIPSATRAAWARLGVDGSSTTSSRSTSSTDKKKTVAQLRKQLADADELLPRRTRIAEGRRSRGTCSAC
jgi:DNA topoisomerase-1